MVFSLTPVSVGRLVETREEYPCADQFRRWKTLKDDRIQSWILPPEK